MQSASESTLKNSKVPPKFGEKNFKCTFALKPGQKNFKTWKKKKENFPKNNLNSKKGGKLHNGWW